MKDPRYSVISPVFNERENLVLLYKKITKVMKKMKDGYEIIFVDDGSTDGSSGLLRKIAEKDEHVRVFILSTNYGQTPALTCGFDRARGDIFITLDSDLQNDPRDIPRLIKKMEKGYDVVSGWRHDRNDSMGKKFFSRISNGIATKMTGLDIHDSGCTLKAYRREAIHSIDLHSEMHRYIPALIHNHGYRVTEVKVRHHQREKGETKYGVKRLWRGPLDLLNLWFWNIFSTRPMHFFGGLGITSFLAGFVINAYLTMMKLVYDESLSNRPLLLLGILLMVLGIQLLMFGFIGDMIIRIHYGEEGKKIYRVRENTDEIKTQK